VTTGFGVVDYDRGRLALVAQGSIGTRRGAELPQRLRKIHDELAVVIEQHAPEAIAVETPFAGQNVKSLIQLAHARGVVLLVAQRAGVELFEYSPRSVKSAIVGFGECRRVMPSGPSSRSRSVSIAFRSAPAENAVASPVRTRARAPSSATKRVKAVCSASAVAPSIAFRRSGRTMRTSAAAPRRS